MQDLKEKNHEGILSNTIKEITEPFKNIFKTSRALLGVNISYLLEGFTYFGMLSLLAIYFNNYVGLDDISADHMVGFLTAGITLSMLFLGAAVDFVGIRRSILLSLILMLIGRIVITVMPVFSSGTGMWSFSHLIASFGIIWIILGYGIYQPACYAAVKQFTDEKTSAIGYAMLYALMNLGGFLPGLMSPPVRKAFDITGVFWVYVAFTVIGIFSVMFLVTKKSIAAATLTEINSKSEQEEKKSFKENVKFYIKNFPLKDKRFLFFIFVLIPVQTLFAHNWLTMPQYCSRAFTGLVKENFEFFVNFNPILIFILTPAVAALTAKKNTYRMMIIGTFVMAVPTFLLALGPSIYTLFAFLILSTIGEAMWQPRFLQWVAEIAPKGMTGIYMGIGQFPWFLTKVITSLYAGWFLMNFCPDNTPVQKLNTEFMWLIYGFIAILSPIGLILSKKWMVAGFKDKAENE